MTYDRASIALSRARDDYAHAIDALMSATSEAARRRHARRARVAEGRIRDAKRDMSRLGCDLAEAG